MDASPEDVRKLTESLNEKLLRAGWISASIRRGGAFSAAWTPNGKEQIARIYGTHLALQDFTKTPLSSGEFNLLRTFAIMLTEGDKEL